MIFSGGILAITFYSAALLVKGICRVLPNYINYFFFHDLSARTNTRYNTDLFLYSRLLQD